MLPSLEILLEISMKSSLNKNLHTVHASEVDMSIISEDIERWSHHYLLDYLKQYCKEIKFYTKSDLIGKATKYENRELHLDTWTEGVLTVTCIVDKYELDYPSYYKVYDYRDGNILDNGYRGVHLIFRANNKCYPIKFILQTKEDYEFMRLSEKYIAQDDNYYLVTEHMRTYYDNNPNISEKDFVNELHWTEKTIIRSQEEYLQSV